MCATTVFGVQSSTVNFGQLLTQPNILTPWNRFHSHDSEYDDETECCGKSVIIAGGQHPVISLPLKAYQ